MLHLHRAERADRLAAALGEVLRVPLPDPFAVEVVAVPARGVERWLVQRLSHVLGATDGIDGGDGICAGVDFPSTGRLLARAVSREDDPWDAERLVWPLLDTIDECVGQPWSMLLTEYLGADDPDGYRYGRRWATAAHLAGLFDSYAAERPGMIRDWAAGRDTDGERPLPSDIAYQAELWRRLAARLGPGPAQRLTESCQRLRDDPASTDLPARLSLFGPTRLSSAQRAILAALAAHREVHLWLPHPSPALWRQLTPGPRARRSVDGTRDDPHHPLLASLGRDARELQVALRETAATVASDDRHHAADADAFPEVTTLLGRLQADIRDDRAPTGDHVYAGRANDERDRSVQVHSCHGPARQVEVLREVLLRLFAHDPTLEPRDVLVMCPDIETYAPLVSAAFGLDDGEHPGHRLRVRLADRSLRQTNPLLDVVARLLELADGRVTASQVLDLAATAPVRARFGFDDDEHERLRGWVTAVGTRWGLDAEHRRRLGLNLPQGTWRTGLDRLLLGVAASEDDLHWLGLALPLDDVDSSDVDLAGRFAELVDRLEQTLDSLAEQPARAWAQALTDGLELLTEVSDADAWQLAQVRTELARAAADSGTVLVLADARAMLADRLRGRPTRANFRTGSLTVATMVPMRSVPHRVIALLGLDDGVFPRVAFVDGDDVLLRDPYVGERDRRSEDRQLLLDALLAAQEHLVITYTGADPLTGQPRPPAVPVGELLDVLDATCTAPVRGRLVRQNPLQPFDRRDFEGEPFSFDRTSLRGARRAVGPRDPPPAFLPEPLPARAGDVELGDLVEFLQNPARALLRQRLGVGVGGDTAELADTLPVTLDGLQSWDVGSRMLEAGLAGADLGHFGQAELRRGTLPPGPLGLRLLADITDRVLALLAEGPRPGAARTVDVRVDLGGGRLLTGTVTGVHGRLLTAITYSRLAAPHRLRAWAQLLAVTCSHPDDRPETWSATVTGRGQRRPVTAELRPPVEPLATLRDLVELRDRGLREPLPMAARTSAAYGRSRFVGEIETQALDAARQEWRTTWGGEYEDRHLELIWGERPELDLLLARPGRTEPTEFGDLAVALWTPLLAAEQ